MQTNYKWIKQFFKKNRCKNPNYAIFLQEMPLKGKDRD